jgi:hypothetical protein
VVYLVRARAKALIQLAETGLGCLSIPDGFHLIPELVTSYSWAIFARRRHARQALSQAQESLNPCQASAPSSVHPPQAQAVVEASDAEVERWENVGSASRRPLVSLSLPLHPWRLFDSTPQTSEEGACLLQAERDAIAVFLATPGFPIKKKALDQVRKQLAGGVRPGGRVVAGGVA